MAGVQQVYDEAYARCKDKDWVRCEFGSLMCASCARTWRLKHAITLSANQQLAVTVGVTR